jgi:hypothetical protein
MKLAPGDSYGSPAFRHTGVTIALAFSPDGQSLVRGGSGACELVVDLAGGDLLVT